MARCRFWFFCCWVSVLFRGGRRDEAFVGVETVSAGEATGETLETSIAFTTPVSRVCKRAGGRVVFGFVGADVPGAIYRCS